MEEKIEILVVMCQDADAATRDKAFDTLKNWDTTELKQVLADTGTPAVVLEFATERLLPERLELAEVLAANSAVPEKLKNLIQVAPDESAKVVVMKEDEAVDATPERQTLVQKINRMTVAEKINAALMGSQEERTILVRDANKVVSRAVLQSPKLSDQEVENIVTMKNVSEEVLRLVAMNRKFVRSYSVARNLLNNPRTPIDTGLPLVHRLNDRDLKELSRNKNVAEVIRSTAYRLVKQKEDANKPKFPQKH